MSSKWIIVLLSLSTALSNVRGALTYPIVDTGQNECYSDIQVIPVPSPRQPFFGQDGATHGNQPRYKDNGDGTISDLVTGLMWEKEMGQKLTFKGAQKKAKELRTGGHRDWRIPSVKELYSLIQFTGQSGGERSRIPFIDTNYFNQPIGDVSKGEREIDAQTWTSTVYTGKTMGRQQTVFGVNFIDGRIKGYPLTKRGEENRMYFRMVRGNPAYGKNKFVDNKDGTITDLSTGLMWQQADNGQRYDWQEALVYAHQLTLAGHSDWRLPNAKELQSIVDYARSPSATNSPAISPLFSCTKQKLFGDMEDYPYYWTSTTHLDARNPYAYAVYICFGQAWGRDPRTGELTDVHGAGAQRSDPKSGDISAYPQFVGPQKDMRCVYNAVRCVRNASSPSKKVQFKHHTP